MGISHILLAACGRPCPYCGEQMRFGTARKRRTRVPTAPTRDHVIPKSVMPAMGTIIVCSRCNHDKGHLLIDQWESLLRYLGDPRADFVRKFMRDHRSMRLSGPRPSPQTVKPIASEPHP